MERHSIGVRVRGYDAEWVTFESWAQEAAAAKHRGHPCDHPVILGGQGDRGFAGELQHQVPGCPEWVTHLDRSREGSFQVVIALTDATHSMSGPTPILSQSGGIAPRRASMLYRRGIRHSSTRLDVPRKVAVAAVAGDVLIMLGGLCVHSSPGVPAEESERIATYVHWVPKGQ